MSSPLYQIAFKFSGERVATMERGTGTVGAVVVVVVVVY